MERNKRSSLVSISMALAAALAALWGVWWLVAATPVHATTFTVDTTLDENDGECNIDCSLRDAIILAGDGDTVTVPAGVYTLSLGEIIFAKNITLAGAGPAQTVLAGSGSARVFGMQGTITIRDLAITGGNIGNVGGGIVFGAGQLSVDNVWFYENTATNGGGLSTIWPGSQVTIRNSRFYSNTATDSTHGGGGVYVNSDAGQVRLIDTLITTNTAATRGGGLFLNLGTVLLTDTHLISNTAGSYGGGVYAWEEGNAILRQWGGSIAKNVAQASDFGGGGMYIFKSSVYLNGVQLNDNVTQGNGGAINVRGVLSMTNCTVSGNRAADGGGGIHVNVFISGGGVDLHHLTVTGNVANSDGDSDGDGGGIQQQSGTVQVAKSIVAGNVDNGGASRPDLSGAFVGNDYNLLGNLSGSSGFSTTGTDISFTSGGITATGDVLDATLQDNGGPNLTHALVSGSAAIDAVPDPAACGLNTDQRGAVRADGANRGGVDCDIGAYEYGSGETPLAINLQSFAAGGITISLLLPLLLSLVLATFTALFFLLQRHRARQQAPIPIRRQRPHPPQRR